MQFDPPSTPEQEAILGHMISSRENLMVEALAGAAKTTTLERIAHVCNKEPILSLAFNKRIADELSKRLPSHCMARTFNSIGHSAWSKQIGRRLSVDPKKNYAILKQLVDSLSTGEKEIARDNFAFLLSAIRMAKISGFAPIEGAKSLTAAPEFWDSLDENPTPTEQRIITTALQTNVKWAYDGTVDFDDQIYMPTVFGGEFPQFPLVLVDETQDLSPSNHEMLRRLVSCRICAVGDRFQSIYAFRGSVRAGMEAMRSTYSMAVLPLSTSFRCPQAVVRAAWWRVPQMTWPEWAIEGDYGDVSPWLHNYIPDNSAIICRNNAPLFTAALRLLRLGRRIRLIGSDIGPNLLRILRSLGAESLTQTQVIDAISRWADARAKRSRTPTTLNDQCECLNIFARQGPTLRAAIDYAESLFKQSGPIELLTGHKAKGLEWDYVYHLDPQRIPSPYAKEEEEREQEWNIRYVIETRARKALWKVTLEDLQ